MGNIVTYCASLLLTSVLDAYEIRAIGVYDIPGAFLHTKQTDTVYIKMTGDVAEFLVAVCPRTYSEFVTVENGKNVIYLLLTRALYGCLKSALLFWRHLSGNLVKRGYTLNPYDMCVANKEIEGNQFTIVWHVDDLKMSHRSEKILNAEVSWLETIYGPLVGSKGNEHTYLGMDLKFNDQRLEVSMIPYLQEIIDDFGGSNSAGAGAEGLPGEDRLVGRRYVQRRTNDLGGHPGRGGQISRRDVGQRPKGRGQRGQRSRYEGGQEQLPQREVVVQFIIHGLRLVLLNEYEITPFQSQEVKALECWQAQSPLEETLGQCGPGHPRKQANCGHFDLGT